MTGGGYWDLPFGWEVVGSLGIMDNYKPHNTVLKERAVRYLCENADPDEKCHFADLTFGGGGHSLEILSQSSCFRVIGVDQDPDSWKNAQKIVDVPSYKNRLIVEKMNFKNFSEWVMRTHPMIFEKGGGFSGILMDLGVSSHQLDTGDRGFSFAKEGSPDMRMASDDDGILTAEDIVNKKSQKYLEQIIREYGEERFSVKIARKIVEQRKIEPIRTTKELENIIFHCYPQKSRYGRIHPATRTFQALRIAVNDELSVLSESIPNLYGSLKERGRLVIMAFHSLEDRIVKDNYKRLQGERGAKIITKKPLIANENEIKGNFRARSVKMRVIEK